MIQKVKRFPKMCNMTTFWSKTYVVALTRTNAHTASDSHNQHQRGACREARQNGYCRPNKRMHSFILVRMLIWLICCSNCVFFMKLNKWVHYIHKFYSKVVLSMFMWIIDVCVCVCFGHISFFLCIPLKVAFQS